MEELAAALGALGLGRYAEAFRAADVDVETLRLLTEDDLKEVGLSLGHRRKLLAAIAEGRLAPPPGEAAPPAHTGEQERRQITVLLCDLVGSTELTERLDPEEMSRIIRQFQDSAAGAISRFDGFLDRFMGDAVLAFFGYPRAHEDAAERAVRTALAIAASIGEIAAPGGGFMAVRVAIASGSAFFGEMVEHGGVREPVVTGEVVNLAARLQTAAPVNGVVIAPQTRRLLRELFILDDLGLHDFKGIARPTRVWRVLGERHAGTRFEAVHGRVLFPIVGREAEIALLRERWHSARSGEGQVVLLSADAGMGKSRIAQVLRDDVAGDGGGEHLVIRYQCSPYHRNSALYPMIAQLLYAARIRPDDAAEVRLQKLEALAEPGSPPDAIALLADLLSIPSAPRYKPPDLSPEERKRKTLQVLIAQLLALARRQPVLMLFEDAHWIDPTTQELLSQCIVHIQDAAVLMLVTYRPEFQPDWASLPHVTTLALSGLPRRQAMAMISQVTGGKRLPPELLNQILARTDGIPLFVEELAKAILELGILRDMGDRYELLSPLPTLTIPDTLHNSLLARLDRHPSTKELAQVGAVIGREFAFAHLSALASVKGDALHAALRDLLRTELVHQRGPANDATYVFKHALIQEAAYSTLLSARRQQLHAQCAAILQEISPQIAEQQPELLAHHYTEAGKTEEAVTHWMRAGRRAAERSANVEAVAHLRHGIHLIPGIADPLRRSEFELRSQLELGVPLIATEGYAAPVTLAAWERARALAEQRGEHRQLARTLYGLWAARASLGETRTALGLADRILEIGARIGDDGVEIVGHRVRALTVHVLGDLRAARAELEGVLALYAPERHSALRFEFGQDPRVAATAILSSVLWGLGHPGEAARMSLGNVERAAALGHANSLAYALAYGACLVAMLRGDPAETLRLANQLIEVATAHHLHLWKAYGDAYKGWALARQGDSAAVMPLLDGAFGDFKRAGSVLYAPLALGVLGYALGRAGRHEDALARLCEAVAEAEWREETWCLPELLRLQARLAQRLGREDAAPLLDRALGLARTRGMRSWEPRIACDRLAFGREGDARAAEAALRSALDAIPEQGDTPDRRRALALLGDAPRVVRLDASAAVRA
jgi:predicted ATPase/class 3 adenylate cyclase